MDNFIMYTKDDCPYCVQLKAAVKQYQEAGKIGNVDIIEINDRDERRKMYASLGLNPDRGTVPQFILVNKAGTHERIGGCNESLEWLSILYD